MEKVLGIIMKRASKQDILDNISIKDIAAENSIGLESVLSGNFTHRCKCPSKDHKHGLERTSSLYIDSINNNFYCFGCSASSNVIDFYMLCKDISFSDAITDLGKRIDASLIKPREFRAVKNNFSIFVEISKTIRDYIMSNRGDILWADRLCKQVDLYYEEIGTEDIRSARKILSSIKRAISKRGYSK